MPRQKEFEREEVLEKALEVFWCNGYNGTSFADLTEGMCINRQSIYDTYGDKHTLFIEVLNHYSEKNGESLRAHFSQDKPARQLFKEYFQAAVQNISGDTKSKGCLINNAALEMIPHDAAVKQIARRNIDGLYKVFLDAIKKGVKTKELSPKLNPEAVAMHLVTTIQGMNTVGKAFADKKRLQSIADTALSVLG
ncbi:MAG: TetR/AcrR family transcriptional regulator [Bacteroidetes bacterium]|nr:TetR/AcrR family transcriptional regulator [Bacteroidota bacterium]